MTQTVFLHVGLPKSGTTYLQGLLTEHKQRLMETDGLLFPGETWSAQVMATRDVRKMRGSHGVDGAWRALVEEIHAWPGDVVVSMEWLCAARAKHVRRIVADLAPSRVKVLFTVRDLGRALPSGWQEMVKNTQTWSWPEFLEAATADDPRERRAGRRFWSKLDLPVMLDSWSTAVPREDLVVITVPPSTEPHDVLWSRMCEVLGIEPRDLGTSISPRNESLGVESTEIMRRLNLRYPSSTLSRDDYDVVLKRSLAKTILPTHRPAEHRLVVPEQYRPWVRETAARQIEDLAAYGVTVVGDLTDLEPRISTEGVAGPDEVPTDRLLDAALHATMGLLEEQARLRARVAALSLSLDRQGRRVERQARRIAQQRSRLARLQAQSDGFRARPLRSGARAWSGRALSRLKRG